MKLAIDNRINRFYETIVAHQSKWVRAKFTWGKSDCCTAVADIIHDVLGYDPMAQFRGRYKTKIGFKRMLMHDGLGSVAATVAFIAGKYKWASIEPGNARTGDIAISGDGLFIAVVNGFWVSRSERGLVVKSNRDMGQVWRPN